MKNFLALSVFAIPFFGNAQWVERNGNAILENGQVGIGVKSPDTYLHIKQDESSGTKKRNFIRLHNINDGPLSGVSLDMWSGKSPENQVRTFISNAAYSYSENPRYAGYSQFAGFNNGVIIRATDSIEGRIVFLMNGSDGPDTDQEAMRINANRNVGIGTRVPFEKLTLSNGNFALNNDYGDRFGITFNRNSVDNLAKVGLNKRDDLVLTSKNDVIVKSRGTIFMEGNVGIGTSNPQSKLAVNGRITAKAIRITKHGWPDYVFNADYDLMSLAKVEKYIESNHHLPGVPSQKEIEEKGLDLGEMDAILLEKIEELTIHLISEKKEIESLKAQMKSVITENKKLKTQLDEIK